LVRSVRWQIVGEEEGGGKEEILVGGVVGFSSRSWRTHPFPVNLDLAFRDLHHGCFLHSKELLFPLSSKTLGKVLMLGIRLRCRVVSFSSP
jgi:hypothetical protein